MSADESGDSPVRITPSTSHRVQAFVVLLLWVGLFVYAIVAIVTEILRRHAAGEFADLGYGDWAGIGFGVVLLGGFGGYTFAFFYVTVFRQSLWRVFVANRRRITLIEHNFMTKTGRWRDLVSVDFGRCPVLRFRDGTTIRLELSDGRLLRFPLNHSELELLVRLSGDERLFRLKP